LITGAPGCGIQLRQRHPRRQGDLGEAAAIHWLTERGANVCVPLFHSPDFDLIADLNGRLARVQVKTSTQRTKRGYAVHLATRGGNQSWTGVVKRFAPSRCDFVFALVADGRRWFIPAAEIEGQISIILGGRKYAEFEIGPCDNSPSTIADRRGSAGAGEPGWTVNSVPQAEWVRIPPPPSSTHTPDHPIEGSLAFATTRIGANHQVTVPRSPFTAAELEVGDQMRVDAIGSGRVVLTRVRELAARHAATLFE
jgi:hypothetical protein